MKKALLLLIVLFALTGCQLKKQNNQGSIISEPEKASEENDSVNDFITQERGEDTGSVGDRVIESLASKEVGDEKEGETKTEEEVNNKASFFEKGDSLSSAELKKAFKEGQQIKCVNKYDSSESRVSSNDTVYIKSDKYFLEDNFEVDGSKFEHRELFDGKMFYSWDLALKNAGLKYTLECHNEMRAIVGESPIVLDSIKSQLLNKGAAGIVEYYEKNKNNMSCTRDNSKVDYIAPSDFKFTDRCEFLKAMAKEIKENGM